MPFQAQLYIRERDFAYRIRPRPVQPFSEPRKEISQISSVPHSAQDTVRPQTNASQAWLFMPSVTRTPRSFDADPDGRGIISPTKYSLVLNLQVNTSHPRALTRKLLRPAQVKHGLSHFDAMPDPEPKYASAFYTTTGCGRSDSKHAVSWRRGSPWAASSV